MILISGSNLDLDHVGLVLIASVGFQEITMLLKVNY